jgi:predicted ArsR family transcriptional regulator
MVEPIIPSDVAILDVLRTRDALTVVNLVEILGVTATAVRQRLNRLLAQGYVDRQTVRSGRGRPSHRYVLTAAGRRRTGANFADLAIALWQEIRAIQDPEVRRGLIQRISRRLAGAYAEQVSGATLAARMESLVTLFGERQVPFVVAGEGELPVLTALACPYPDLAEQDRSVCAMERMLFSELLGRSLRLSRCRLDGETCCTFEVGGDEAV